MKPILDSRKLLAFTTLARLGSFTLAARELFLTQSAVSHAIRALEEELNCRLFERLGRKVRLTYAGRQLLLHADRILLAMQDARSELEGLRRRRDKRLQAAGGAKSDTEFQLVNKSASAASTPSPSIKPPSIASPTKL